MTALLRTGVVGWAERPLWYDVYASFPPVREPRADDIRFLKAPQPLPHLYYPEDFVRAFLLPFLPSLALRFDPGPFPASTTRRSSPAGSLWTSLTLRTPTANRNRSPFATWRDRGE